MKAAKNRILARKRKKAHVRKRISGSAERPRITVFRSAKHIYAQAIDDVAGVTLISASTVDKELKGGLEAYTGGGNTAESIGKAVGERLKAKGIEAAVFDRNGYLYHGRIKKLADGIREAGIKM